MRLLYVFTEFKGIDGKEKPYRGMDSIELNFSTTERFEYKKDENLINCTHRNPSIPQNFWATDNRKTNIYNISVFAGQNGSGKTTVMQYIIDLLYTLYAGNQLHGINERHAVLNNRNIVILEEEEKKSTNQYTKIIYDLHSRYDLIHNRDKIRKIRLDNSPDQSFVYSDADNDELLYSDSWTCRESIKHSKIIYLTNMLSLRDFDLHQDEYGINHRKYFVYNCSPGANLAEGVGQYYPFEIYKQVKYVFDKRQYTIRKQLRREHISLPMPLSLTINLRKHAYPFVFSERFPETYKLLPNINCEEFWILQPNIAIAIWLCALCVMAYEKNLNLNHDIIPVLDSSIFVEKDENEQDIIENEFIGQIKNATKYLSINNNDLNDNKKVDELETYCIAFIHFVLSEKNTLFRHVEYKKHDDINLVFDLPVKAIIDADSGIMIDKLNEFIRSYRLTCKPNYTINYSWGLSSGEENLLRMFASLHHIFDQGKIKGGRKTQPAIINDDLYGEIKSQSLFIFFDEADLTFHPDWQRDLIYILASVLPQMYPKSKIKDIQVFISTHSPLLLGDIPSGNIQYLPNGSKCEINTFGQNIHTILRNSFFLNHGTIGAFATEKINNVARKMNQICDETIRNNIDGETIDHNCAISVLSECKSVIDLVSPGILKNKLMQLYDHAYAIIVGKTSANNDIIEDAKKLSDKELQIRIDTYNAELNRRKYD